MTTQESDSGKLQATKALLKAFPDSSTFKQGLNWSKNNCSNEQSQSDADGGRLQRGCSSRQGGTFIIPKMSTGDWDGQRSSALRFVR